MLRSSIQPSLVEETRFELRPDGKDGVCYYLEGQPIANGDPIEVLLSKGRWMMGYFQWSGAAARWPGLRLPLGGPWEGDVNTDSFPMAVVALPPSAIVRRLR